MDKIREDIEKHLKGTEYSVVSDGMVDQSMNGETIGKVRRVTVRHSNLHRLVFCVSPCDVKRYGLSIETQINGWIKLMEKVRAKNN